MMMHVDTAVVEEIASTLRCDAFYYVMETADAPRLEMGPSGPVWITALRTTIDFLGFRDNGDCMTGRWDRAYRSVATSRTWTYLVHGDEVLIRAADGSSIRGLLSEDHAALTLGSRTYVVGHHGL
jgi:hypothetical protein